MKPRRDQRYVDVRLTAAQIRALLSAVVHFEASYEDESDRSGGTVTLIELRTLDRAMRAILAAARAAGVDLSVSTPQDSP